MPRPLRIFFPGAWYHVMNRGSGSKNIFTTNKHRKIFTDLLSETFEQFHLEIHGYCLMPNHYHLLVRTPCGNLSRAMRHINGVYTQHYNRDTKTDGSLFRGRYKAILIEGDSYLLQVSRYIHLNPLMAKMIKNLETFTWSSYRYYISLDKSPTWLRTENILSMIAKRNHALQYKKFVMDGVDDETYSFYADRNTKVYLGAEKNKRKLIKTLNSKVIQASITDYRRLGEMLSLNDIIESCTRFFCCPINELQSIQRGRTNICRNLAIYVCRKWTQATLEEIGSVFCGMSVTGVSNAINRTKVKLEKDVYLRNLFVALEEKIFNG